MARSKKKLSTAAGHKVVARNKRALRDYTIDERIEAGMVLRGSEVKSLREGRVSLGDAYAEVRGGEVFLVNAHIAEYPQASLLNHPPLRERKLLLHKDEIRKLGVRVNERGYTLVPLAIYFKGGRAKVELGLGKGRRQYEKRDAVRRRDVERDMAVEERRRR